MSPDQETGTNIQITHQPSEDHPIRGQLNVLRSRGEYLIKQLPSDLDNNFFIELEGSVNSIYTDLDGELTSGKTTFKPKVLKAVKSVIAKEILPAVSGWSDYAKKHPVDESRPKEFFENIKSVGEILRDLYKKL